MKFTSLILIGALSVSQAIKLRDDGTDQVVALGQKLGLDVTADMFAGQSPEDVTQAIIGAALESGKSQADIEAAMSGQDTGDSSQAAAQTTTETASKEVAATTEAAASDSAAGTQEKLTDIKVEITKAGTGK